MSLDPTEMLDKLRSTPARLERLVEQNPSDVLSQAGTGGGWGAVEIMAFLRDWDEITLDRVEQMIESSNPELDEEDTELWSIERDYHVEDPENVVEQIRKGREELVARLQTLSERQWSRTARMPDGTVVTVADLVEQLVNSDRERVNEIREILL